MKNHLPFNGELYLVNDFYSTNEAQIIFDELLQNIDWQQEKLFIYGRTVKVPRLMCWFGDKNTTYHYSGVTHQPYPWSEQLLSIKQKIESFYPCSFNSVMANLYQNGSDSMGCHADDEKELGKNPLIASLNFGEQRLIKFRHNKSKKVIDLLLSHGDLLIMAGETQHYWKHEIPKTKTIKTERINLTFRKTSASLI